MAKSNSSQTVSEQAGATSTLAEKLFVATWRLGGTSNDEHVAKKCIEAAKEFERVQRELTNT